MQRREEQFHQTRRSKVAALRQAGVDPFGSRFPGRRLAGDLARAFADATAVGLEAAAVTVRVAGRVVSLRPHGKAGFAHLQDGSGRIQLYLRVDELGATGRMIWEQADLGDILGANGLLMRTRTGELTVRVTDLRLLTKAIRPLPDKHGGLRDVEEWNPPPWPDGTPPTLA